MEIVKRQVSKIVVRSNEDLIEPYSSDGQVREVSGGIYETWRFNWRKWGMACGI